ncbi:hypothetical protein EV361DRAFT_523545 [Lentinula raphanica]|nr:hypothetical protein F5880DRAFT_1190833 [Lentinula raphanica]KAJ3967014.1 hypothetical protein EV361DRAFT_523545 [Lentinula raphanica]
MSATSAKSLDFDFWEFVCCSKCQLPFNSSGSTVPFWLTECGHVICNNHLSPDQTCAQCKSSGIQLIPLQYDMEPPMSEWFRSVPYMLDSAAYAVKFQQESMASQIRNLKARYQQQRTYIDQLKQDNIQLKRVNEMLTKQLSDGVNRDNEPATFTNANGKRPMIDVPHLSSPRSGATPSGPNRITLPPGQHPPQLSSNQATSSSSYNTTSPHLQRPGTSRFTQQFAYTPAHEASMRPPLLSHTQAAPKQPRVLQAYNKNTGVPSSSHKHPTPHIKSNSSPYNFDPSQAPHSSMGPPQVPRHASTNIQASPSRPVGQASNPKRFLPLSERFPPPPGTADNTATSRRFIPPVSTSRNQFRPATSLTSHVPASRGSANFSGGIGQRMPFVPGQS